MSTAMQPLALDLVLPWEVNKEQDERFQTLLKRLLLVLLLLFILIPFLPIFEKPFEETQSDVTITKLILPPVTPEPPPAPIKKAEPPKEIVKEIPKKDEKVKPDVKAATIKTTTKKKSGSAEKTAVKSETVDEKIAVQSSQGLNELSSQLSALRGSLDLTRMQNKNLSNNTTGSAARSPKQLLGTDQITQKSGGINVDDSVMKSSSTSLAEHTTTAVDGFVESGVGPSGNQAYYSSRKGQRDMESIRRTFERAKSNVDSLYQRALRDQPGLEGKFVFRLVIEPDGSVSALTLISSELGIENLNKDILSRIRQLNFGPEDVAQQVVDYKYYFVSS